MRKSVLLIAVFLISLGAIQAQKLESVKVERNEVYIDSMMNHALEKGFFPGAQIIVGTGDFNLISKNYGYHDYTKKQLVKTGDVFDLASMSKVLGATLVTMRLVGENKIKLTDQ